MIKKWLYLLIIMFIFGSCQAGTDIIVPVNTNEPAVIINNGCEDDVVLQYGYVDIEGNIAIEPVFFKENIFLYGDISFHDGRAMFSLDNKLGFIDKTGQTVIEPVYDDTYDFHDGFAWVEKDGKWGKINVCGDTAVDFKFDFWIQFPEDEWIAVYNDGLWGFADQDGNIVIDYAFTHVGRFIEGYALVNTGAHKTTTGYNIGVWGSIDKKGNYAVEPELCLPALAGSGGAVFHNGLALVWDGSKTEFYINTKCEIIDVPKDFVNYEYSEGLAIKRFESGWIYGFINESGDIAIEPQFGYGSSNFSDGLACVEKNGLYGYIDRTGATVIPFRYENASDFNDGLAFADNMLIDKQGNAVFKLPGGYRFYGEPFSEGLAPVVKE